MANVLGDVSVGGGFDSTRLILNDAASATADNVAFEKAPLAAFATRVTGLYPGTVYWDYRQVTSVTLLAGSGADTVFYPSDTTGPYAALFGGRGDDQFVLTASSGVGNTATLAFDGAEGDDRFDVIGGRLPAGTTLSIQGGADTDFFSLASLAGDTAAASYVSAGRGPSSRRLR